MIKKLELTEKEHIELFNYCRLLGIEFMSTPFDLDSIDFLSKLGVKKIKIPSGEITNLPYLKKIAALNLPTILSTGMSNMDEIEIALNILLNNGLYKNAITVLHCNTQYPTPFKDVNLLAMNAIKEKFGVDVGYSDHTLGQEVAIAAVALGATIIEKHFTISNKMEGPDHLASMEPQELICFIKSIRNIQSSLGSSIKKVTDSEQENLNVARRSLFLFNDILKGHIICETDLIAKRPGIGISPMEIENVVGKRAKYDLKKDDLLKWSDLIIS
jgi:sialic acid synthase SpsE